MTGQRVRVLDVLSHVLRRQLADQAAVGFDHDAMLVEMSDGPARPVIDIE